MLSKLKFICIILYLFSCIDIVYGNEISKIEDLLNENISLKDKVEYLNYIKYDGSFSKEDIDILMRVFEKNETFDFAYALGISDTPLIHNNSKDIDKKDKIRGFILEILLKDDVDEDILTLSQMSWIAFKAIGEIDSSDTNVGYIKNRYLALKVLIKINELRPNVDDNISKKIRETIYDNLENSLQNNPNEIRSEIDSLLQELFPNNRNKIVELESLLSLNNPEKMFRKIGENRVFYSRTNVWQHRSIVEDHIFDPILLELDGNYIEKDRVVLYDYEQYLLEHLKFFPTTDNLKRLVEAAFLKTRFVEFRPQYIDAMFYLDMEETLLKIILDSSIELGLKKQAIDVSLKLLNEVNVLAFKKFSKSLLEALEIISSNIEEQEEFRSVSQKTVTQIQSMIDKRDEIKDFESILFRPNISKEEKLEYLNELIRSKFSFSKIDLGVIKRILDSASIDREVKAVVSFIILYTHKAKYLIKRINSNYIESMVYLFMNFIKPNSYNYDSDMISTVSNRWHKTISILEQEGVVGKFDLYYKLDMWEKFIDYLSNKDNDSTMKALAIRMSLDLLAVTRSFEEFSYSFLQILQKILEEKNQDQGLRNMAGYIINLVKSGKISLKDGGDCVFKFIL